MTDTDLVELISHDEKKFTLPLKAAKLSLTVKNLIEDAGLDHPIPLPNVEAKILEKVVAYLNHHSEHPEVQTEEKKDERRTDDISDYDRNLCMVDQNTLFYMILAANYLDIKGLLDVTCKTVANMIKGKTPDEVRQTFNIKNDFTPEEYDAVRKENEWLEER